jgi:hypothetical protein
MVEGEEGKPKPDKTPKSRTVTFLTVVARAWRLNVVAAPSLWQRWL